MVGCSLITRPGAQWCADALADFNFRLPFTLGPFSEPGAFRSPFKIDDVWVDDARCEFLRAPCCAVGGGGG